MHRKPSLSFSNSGYSQDTGTAPQIRSVTPHPKLIHLTHSLFLAMHGSSFICSRGVVVGIAFPVVVVGAPVRVGIVVAATLVGVMVRIAVLGCVGRGRIIACVVIIALSVFSSGICNNMMGACISS